MAALSAGPGAAPWLPALRLAALLQPQGLAEAARQVQIDEDGEAEGCRLPVAGDAAAALAACCVAADQVWQLRGGRPQQIALSTRHAGLSLRSYAHLWIDGRASPGSPSDNTPLARYYATRDGRWFFIHGMFEHLAAGTLRVLGIREATAEAIGAAVARRDAQELEDALAEARMCGAYARSAAEWAAHPQGSLLAGQPCVEVIRIGDAPPQPLPPAARPLSGLRVLDMTRVLAGPTAARTLAEHGADVLNISSPALPSMPTFVIDTGHGKRSAQLDLNRGEDHARLLALADEADVLVQGYRSGTLAARGLAPEALAARRPGIVYVSINCYGHEGPWTDRPGWDQLAATATGLAMRQGAEQRPALLPAAACDYVTGYLAAFGTLVALARRAREGGSWHVRASLSQTATWFQQQPDIAPAGHAPVPTFWLQDSNGGFGQVRHLRPVARMSLTRPAWDLPVEPLGTHAPQWLPR